MESPSEPYKPACVCVCVCVCVCAHVCVCVWWYYFAVMSVFEVRVYLSQGFILCGKVFKKWPLS